MEWISVKKKLPNGVNEFLCWVVANDGSYAKKDLVQTWITKHSEVRFNCGCMEHVTHWILILPPEPPND